MDSANRQLARPIIRYLSVCSGIEAATVAWHPLGWQAAGFSEIDPFARAVLEHRYPGVPLHGDFTGLKTDDYGTIDLLVGGTPCQSFSIAGLRKGLADDRGNLALEFIRLAEATRARWVVWENVPGVLSIDGGRAFGSFLGGLAECGYGFSTAAGEGNALTIGDIPAGQHKAIWVKRIVGAGAAAYNADSVVIKVQGDTAA